MNILKIAYLRGLLFKSVPNYVKPGTRPYEEFIKGREDMKARKFRVYVPIPGGKLYSFSSLEWARFVEYAIVKCLCNQTPEFEKYGHEVQKPHGALVIILKAHQWTIEDWNRQKKAYYDPTKTKPQAGATTKTNLNYT